MRKLDLSPSGRLDRSVTNGLREDSYERGYEAIRRLFLNTMADVLGKE